MWCPKAGCETVCVIESNTHASTSVADVIPSASTPTLMQGNPLQTAATTVTQIVANPNTNESTGHDSKSSVRSPVVCAVVCPSCKEEFCSVCKKAVRI